MVESEEIAALCQSLMNQYEVEVTSVDMMILGKQRRKLNGKNCQKEPNAYETSI